ncbi:hypothetical protein CAPTEDRAFT_213316 [Capitella teleta]|uniref:snRNA-activating protein complex subunit 5 n=1 Tax=Capitella teleta TaxID=283909 RepID=R7V0I8_CAPTE|nr:hypothetical protein CAPTEDRAFT_213316 [Capitella teleta]|eukprot:ELU12353.1 hypothetical protein CAPTEDRAFT_213316 [Capitella teleta]
MSTHSELLLLREEEKVLMELRTKLTDQLNRLKVEELALQSHIRSDENAPLDLMPSSSDQHSEADANLGELNLDVFSDKFGQGGKEEEEEEEDEDEDMETDLTNFVEQLKNQ